MPDQSSDHDFSCLSLLTLILLLLLLLLFFLPVFKNEIKQYFDSKIKLLIARPIEQKFDIR
jgi:hypothetical protein